ncbi:MAG: GlsB/YeaQ/YmgE family stress response membrane protein [Reyranella sp.]
MDMSTQSILVILLVGIVAGWLAGTVVRGAGFGLLGDLVIGIVGAFIATLLFPRLGLHLGSGILSEIIFSALGAIILLLIVGLIRGRRV